MAKNKNCLDCDSNKSHTKPGNAGGKTAVVKKLTPSMPMNYVRPVIIPSNPWTNSTTKFQSPKKRK